jgi:hypothetical protein
MGWEKYLMAIIAIGIVTTSISLASTVEDISDGTCLAGQLLG